MADRTDTETEPELTEYGDVELELDTALTERLDVAGFSIPQSVEMEERYVIWRQEGDSKTPKAPVFTDDGGLRNTDPTTMSDVRLSYPYARQFVHRSNEKLGERGADGVGMILTDDDPYLCFDFDDIRDPESGLTERWAVELINELDSYTELSPSGTGAHTLVRAPDGLDDDFQTECDVGSESALELYATDHYVTITGERVVGSPYDLAERDKRARDVQRAMMDEDTDSDADAIETSDPTPLEEIDGTADSDVVQEIIELACEHDDEFDRLYSGQISGYNNDHSRADFSLCCKLAFWTGDRQLTDRIFRQSGLMRPKWDAERGNTTYGWYTIEKAFRANTDRCDRDWG